LEPNKPALKSKSGSEKASGPWRPTKRQVLWVIGMVVALLTTALLIYNLRPEIWKSLLKERNLPLIAIGVSVAAIIVLLAVGGATSRWTGFRGKTVWDWMDLLIVPMVLVGIGLLFEMQQADRQQATEKKQQELAERQAQDEALRAYLDQMGRLMLDGKLHDSKEGSEVRTLAQARTQTVLARLDGSRRGSVVEFLYEASLINKEDPVISLFAVHLDDAKLSSLDLTKADLSGAYLNRAELSVTRLKGADLEEAQLDRADLGGAILEEADLSYSDLDKADLLTAHLNKAELRTADLSGANLKEADLSNANLINAMKWTDKQLTEVKSFEGATMPDGQRLKNDDNPDRPTFEEWLKSKDREGNGKSGGSS
jgi:uncharacterized protein YjbI with pentapeptide repeats